MEGREKNLVMETERREVEVRDSVKEVSSPNSPLVQSDCLTLTTRPCQAA